MRIGNVVKMKRTISQISTESENLQIQLLSSNGKVPTRSTSEAAGYDLYSSEDITIPAHTRRKVTTDIAIHVPKGTYGRIAPRSGLAVKHAIDIGAGVIDKDYRGPVLICLINNSQTDFQVNIGDRIAQLILKRIRNPETKLVESLSLTERGTQGFGSTGSREILKSNKPLHGERLYFNAKLRIKGKEISTRLLLDCRATSPILREGFVKEHEILTKKKSNPIKIWNASQQPIAEAGWYYTQPTGLEIGNHSEALVWEVGVIEDSVDGYLPVAWLQKHNPDVKWESGQVKWRSPYCIQNCLPKQVNAILVDAAQLIKKVSEDTDVFVATLEWRTEDGLEVLKILPNQYHRWANIFSREQTTRLPEHTK